MEPCTRIAPRALTFACVFAFSAFAGCARDDRPQPLSPAVFAPSGRTVKPAPTDPLSAADQPGALYEQARDEGGPPPRNEGDAARQGDPLGGVSRTVQENVRAPGARPEDLEVAPAGGAAAPAATTTASRRPPAPPRPTTSSGQFLTVGGVVMEVNGTPIYANQVINLVEPVLSARAKELDEPKFRALAMQEIRQQVLALRNLELEYAAAERNLEQKDKDLADLMTMNWRQRQISAAGGSYEVARQRAAARGEDFEELVKQQYRVFMSRIYYEKKVIPRIQVSADNMRAYYERNRDREFADPGAARFRLIKIDVKKAGSREAALDKITGVRNRIVKAGEPFESMARSVNDDARLLASGGDLGQPIQKGAFALEPVEKAVWETDAGQVTQVIDAGNALYIAKVEEKKTGSVKQFEDDTVQTQIYERLRGEQFRELRQQVQDNLVKNASVRSEPDMLNTAVEMAMQNYAGWAER